MMIQQFTSAMGVCQGGGAQPSPLDARANSFRPTHLIQQASPAVATAGLAASKPQWVMCRPDYYGVEYVINSWMEGNVGKTHRETALLQWQALHRTLSPYAQVSLIPSQPALPDLCFTANAGLVLNHTFIPSHFRYIERQREEVFYLKWFEEHGFSIKKLDSDKLFFEGEGDALFQPGERLLWFGYGMRSQKEAQQSLAKILDVEVIPLQLINPYFYHLDTCFAPLPKGRILYYPAAFDEASLKTLYTRIPESKRLAVSEQDARNFTCNAIISENTFISNHVSSTLRAQLENWGLHVITLDLKQFMLAGGAAKCLVLYLT